MGRASPQNLVQKIIARHAAGGDATPGSFVRLRPRRVMSHDNTAAIIPKFEALFAGSPGPPTVQDPRQPVIALDHDVQNHTPENLGKYARIEAFARRHSLTFHRAGRGVGHQLMVERGHILPGWLCVASDSHANMYGALGALGAPIVRTDAAVLWATGQAWWMAPPVLRVEFSGAMRPGVCGKDVILTLASRFPSDALNTAVEFGGPGLAGLAIADRLTIANMTTEWGATSCVVEADERTLVYLAERAASGATDSPIPDEHTLLQLIERPDPDARYTAVIRLDLATIQPMVTGPRTVSVAHPAAELERQRIRIDRAYLMSCANARLEDLERAAAIVRGRRVAAGVRFYVAAASAQTQRSAESSGAWAALLAAGATPLPAGCGACIGLGEGLIQAGEVAISATNRNFPGRMGHRDGEVYLASPEVVAASALAGYITGPEAVAAWSIELAASIEHPAATPNPIAPSVAGEPIRGRAIAIPEKSVSTDAIFPGAWTYREGLEPADLAAVAFQHLDPDLAATLRPGDILLTGPNFGTGSSREQAATALRAAGIAAVVCESVSDTYLRNAINNGLLCLICPGLSALLQRRSHHATGETRILGPIELDPARGLLHLAGDSLPLSPLPTFLADLLHAGGLEAWARRELARHTPELEPVP